MEGVKQFEIWWANLPEPVGRRFATEPQRDYEYLSKFVAVEITSNVRGIASEISLGDDEGLPKACVANGDSLRMVPRSSLTRLAGK